MDQVRSAATSAIQAAFARVIERQALPQNVSMAPKPANVPSPVPDGYRPSVADAQSGVHITAQTRPPAKASLVEQFRVLGATHALSGPDLVIVDRQGSVQGEYQIEGFYPELTVATEQRLEVWATQVVSKMLANLTTAASKQLKESGYS
jgi:hypothetical protein